MIPRSIFRRPLLLGLERCGRADELVPVPCAGVAFALCGSRGLGVHDMDADYDVYVQPMSAVNPEFGNTMHMLALRGF